MVLLGDVDDVVVKLAYIEAFRIQVVGPPERFSISRKIGLARDNPSEARSERIRQITPRTFPCGLVVLHRSDLQVAVRILGGAHGNNQEHPKPSENPAHHTWPSSHSFKSFIGDQAAMPDRFPATKCQDIAFQA